MSGLRLNNTKTEALWIGSMAGKNKKLFPERNFRWPENKVKVLGVWISTNHNIMLNLNFREKVDTIRNVLGCWKYRRLTLLRKILVIKSLAASQLTYIQAPLVTNHRIISEINDLFYSFLWNNKGDKIKRSVMINDYDKGGLKMVDITLFNKSLKTNWIKKYLDDSNHGKWKEFFGLELRKYGGKSVFIGNLNKNDTRKTITVQDPFVQELLEIWSEVNFCKHIKTKQQFLEQPIWHNLLIRIEDKPTFNKQLSLHGITKIAHLMKDSHNFLSFDEFINTHKIQVKPMKYFGLISTLRYHYSAHFPKKAGDTITPDPLLHTFLKSDKGNRLVYKKLLSTKSTSPVKSQLKWNNSFPSDENWTPDWKAAKCTKSTKLVNFQYRFLHRILPTNVFLTKIRIKEDQNCSFCSGSSENLALLFWLCPKVSLFWDNLVERLERFKLIPRNYSKDVAIFLGLRSDNSVSALQLNLCFLLARYFIWCCRVNNN